MRNKQHKLTTHLYASKVKLCTGFDTEVLFLEIPHQGDGDRGKRVGSSVWCVSVHSEARRPGFESRAEDILPECHRYDQSHLKVVVRIK